MLCVQCQKLISNKQKFCSSSCSAKYNNSKRSVVTFNKQRQTLLKTIENMSLIDRATKYSGGKLSGDLHPRRKMMIANNQPVCVKSYKCKVCDNPTAGRKTCSDKCLKIHQRNLGTANLRKRRLAGENFSFRRQSNLEKTFEKFIKSKRIRFLKEVYARKEIKKGTYYRLDFVFPSKRMIVEIDGKHHESPNQLKHDVVRDFLMLERGWNTLRINYYEVNKIEILEQIFQKYLS